MRERVRDEPTGRGVLSMVEPVPWPDSLELLDALRLRLALLDPLGQAVAHPEIVVESDAPGVVSIASSPSSALLTAERLGSASITASVDDPRFVVEPLTLRQPGTAFAGL